MALIAVCGIGAEAMANSRSPLEVAAQTFQLPRVGIVVALGATTAMLGVLLSQLLGISRMIFAMARKRDLPAVFDHVNPTHGVPDRGIILAGIVAVLVALFGTLEDIVAAAAFTILLYYSIANLATLRMRTEDKLFPDWIPVLGLITCLLLAFTLPVNVILTGLALLAIGVIWRLLFRRWVARDAAAWCVL